MADAAVSATIQVALQTVVSLAADHVNLVREFPKELERLNESAEMIRGFLAGADEEMHSPVVQNWLRRLEEEVFKADNVLDELNYEILRRRVKYQDQPMQKKVFFCFSFFNKIGFRWRLGSMIREINTNLERIHQNAERLGLPYKLQVEEAFPTIAAGAATSRQTDSTIVRSDVLAVYSTVRETINERSSASLRTLFLKGGIADDMLSKFKYLHVLKLFGADVKELPTSIGKLIHLHLLDISGSWIRTLPESLCELYSLQTLRTGKLEEGFPKEMSNLISMRHLHYDHAGTRREIQMPSGIGRWTCLQTLEFFNIGRQEEGRGIQELGTLQDLKGSLEIRNLELVNGKADAELANLSKKPNLYRLVFEWGNRDRESNKCDEDVLEGLQPHPNLKELQILKFMGDQFPQWFMNLTSLVELRVEDCTRCRELPTLGQLPFLKRLYLCRLQNIRSIGLSFYSTSAEEDGGSGGSSTISRQTFFPALKKLSLKGMKNLEEWKDAPEMMSTAGEVHVMDVFPVLEKLSISDCPQLTTIPTASRFPSLDVLKIKRNCHVLRAEKVLSNIANLSSLELRGGSRQRIESLKLVKRPESSLSIYGCDSLSTDMLERLCLFPTLQSVELWSADNITTLRGMSCAACLKRLAVFYCDNLQELPEDFYQFQALEHLEILCCKRIDSFGYPNPKNSFGQKGLLKSLEQFTVDGCDALTRLPAEMFESCTSLRKLKLSDCWSLVSFPLDLRQTPSLESFRLRGCPNLIAELPSGFGYLTSLRKVTIGPFSDDSVIEFDWAGLASSSSLRHVSLLGTPELKSLPHQLQDLTTITSLSLKHFGAIEALPDWLGNLASLDELILFGCEKLEYLPSIDAMERLKLRRLEIRFCPLLERRCTPQSSSEWPKISNIPERRIIVPATSVSEAASSDSAETL